MLIWSAPSCAVLSNGLSEWPHTFSLLEQEEALSAPQLQTLLSIALEPGELGTGVDPTDPPCVLIHDAAGSQVTGALDSA